MSTSKLTSGLDKKEQKLFTQIIKISCLNDLLKITKDFKANSEIILQKVIERIPTEIQKPEISCAILYLDDTQFKSKNFNKTPWSLNLDIFIKKKNIGNIILYYAKNTLLYEKSILRRERNFLNEIVKIIEDYLRNKSRQDKLFANHIELEAIYEYSPLPIMLVDGDRRVRKANKLALEFANRSEKEMLGLRGGEAMRCLNRLHDPRGCGFGPACQSCAVRNTVLTTFKEKKNFYNIEATLPFIKDNKQVNLSFMISTVFLQMAGTNYNLISLSDITEIKKSRERLRESEHDLKKRVKEINCLYGISKLAGNIDYSMDIFFRKMLELLPPAWQYPEITCARIIYDNEEHTTKNFKETKWKLSYHTFYKDKEMKIYVYYLENKPFLKEEEQLIEEIGERLKKIIEQKESELELLQIYNNSIASLVININLNIIRVNNSFLSLFKLKEEEVIGMRCNDFWQGLYCDTEECCMKQLISGKTTCDYEKELELKEGSKKFLLVTNRSLKDINGKIIGCIKSFTNITEQKKYERKLKRLNKLKTELIDRTSHELNTPLISIKGFTELLLIQYSGTFNDSIINIIKEIEKGSNRLEHLIKNILETSQLSSEKVNLNLKTENLSNIIKKSIESLKGYAKIRNISIDLNAYDDLFILCDKEKLFEVFNHLILNAIKFTPPKGKVLINSKKNNNTFEIKVKDTGLGITQQEKKRLFKQFGKIERYGKGWDVDIEGSGLGLYICKKIVELHGGEIWVESGGRDKGSTFKFTLPLTGIEKIDIFNN